MAWQALGQRGIDNAASAVGVVRCQNEYDRYRMTNNRQTKLKANHCGSRVTTDEETDDRTGVLYCLLLALPSLGIWHGRLKSAEKPDSRVSQAVNKRNNHTSLAAKLNSHLLYLPGIF